MNKIHIGYPKTATTFLQRQVFPQLINHEFVGHKKFRQFGLIDLIWRADRSVDYEKLRLKFKKGNYFISFEDLSGPLFQGSMMIDEIPNRLLKIFGENIKILITIRRQEDLLRSIYTQYIHQGGTISLENFLQNEVYGGNRLDLNAFNYLETYERYLEVFGKSMIEVLPYEKLNLTPQDFVNSLNIFFENEDLRIMENKLIYRSMSGFQLRLLKNFNRFLQSPISEKYIIPPSIINQSKLRFSWQESNFLRFGRFLNDRQLNLLKSISYRYYDSNRILDERLQLGLHSYNYY